MVHKTEDIIAWVTRFFTLLPGDVILTGTPPGVGVFRKPPEFLKVCRELIRKHLQISVRLHRTLFIFVAW